MPNGLGSTNSCEDRGRILSDALMLAETEDAEEAAQEKPGFDGEAGSARGRKFCGE
jgi:hypothetical protein